MRFFDGPEQAESAGFRPCRRCLPREAESPAPHRQAILAVCRLIDEAETPPTLKQLADAVGLSPAHVHRLFKAQVGLTPKQYTLARREARARQLLEEGSSVSEAAYDAGYGSSSRFYAQANGHLGMKPATYRDKGEGELIRYAMTQCDLGWLLVGTTDRGLCAIQLGDDRDGLVAVLHKRFSCAEAITLDESLADTVSQVARFIEQPQRGLDLPLDIQGTAFQRRVWQALREIPLGETVTYKQISERIGRPTATRAVASACGANKLAVIIPCHRVLRSDGGLGGYRWGLERKKALLEREEQS